MTEEWRPVRGWEGYYEVSNLGNVRSVDRRVPNGRGGTYAIKGSNLSPRLQMHGYLIVTLRRGKSVRVTARVHRLVAEAFVPNSQNLPYVNHKDNNRANNLSVNLEWCTQKENLNHARRQGRMPDNYWVGKRSPNAALSDEAVSEIRRLYAVGSHSHQAFADKFGTSKRSIGRVLKRETYADV